MTAARVTLLQLHAFLERSLLLEEMSLCGDLVAIPDVDLPHDNLPVTVMLPRLQRLELSDFENIACLVDVIHMLKMPRLNHLVLADLRDNSDREPIDFSEFLSSIAGIATSSGFSATLKTLRLANVRFLSSSGWTRLLHSLPYLQDLHIVHPDTDEADPVEGLLLAAKYFEALLSRGARSTLGIEVVSNSIACPVLRELTTYGFDYQTLRMIVEDRRTSGLPLVRITASTHDGLSLANIETLESLGVKVEEYEDSDYDSDLESTSDEGTRSDQD